MSNFSKYIWFYPFYNGDQFTGGVGKLLNRVHIFVLPLLFHSTKKLSYFHSDEYE